MTLRSNHLPALGRLTAGLQPPAKGLALRYTHIKPLEETFDCGSGCPRKFV